MKITPKTPARRASLRSRTALGITAALLASSLVAATPAMASETAPVPTPSATSTTSPTPTTSPAPSTPTVTPQRAAYVKAVAARKALSATVTDVRKIASGSKARYLTAADRRIVKKALAVATKARSKAVKTISETSVSRSTSATKALTKARSTLLKKTAKQRSRVSARVAAQSRFTKARTAAGKALKAERKLSTGPARSKLAARVRDKASLKSLRAKLVKAQAAALKKRKTTSATATVKAAKSLNAAAARLQKKVNRLTKVLVGPVPSEDKVVYWVGSACGSIVSGRTWWRKDGWTRALVIADAKQRKCTRLLEAYGFGDDDWRVIWS